MMKPLRVGVVGLGRRWRKRYKPALLALRKRFQVRALCDAVQHVADQESKLLECEAAAGPTEMLENDTIDALLLLETQWFGLWPVQAACRYRKPVFCAASLACEGDRADALVRQVRDSQLPVMMALAPRLAPATVRLRELLSTSLGSPRVLLCDAVYPMKLKTPAPSFGTLALIDWCVTVMGRLPVSIQACPVGVTATASLMLEFGDGRAAQIVRRLAPAGCGALRLQVCAERGTALAELPRRVRWTASDGKHVHVLPSRSSLILILLKHFHTAVTTDQAPEPSLDDTYRVLRWFRAAEKTWGEGRRVELAE